MANGHTVAAIMATRLITLRPDQDIYDAMTLFQTHRISGAPVLDEHGALAGVLSEKDCIRVLVEGAYSQSPGGLVRDYMSTTVETVAPEMPVLRLAERFLSTSFRRFPVVDAGGVVRGQVSRRDVLQHILALAQETLPPSSDAAQTGRMARSADEIAPDLVGPGALQRF